MFRILTAAVLSLAIAGATPSAWSAPKSERGSEVSTNGGTKKHLQVIVFAGLAGAILGLSTLSFYGRPQDKLNNIAIGAAVGIISGTIYSTFRVATEARDDYGLRDYRPGELYALVPENRFKAEELSAPNLSNLAALSFSF